ncbi:MAG: glycosyltransferase [bacterium]
MIRRVWGTLRRLCTGPRARRLFDLVLEGDNARSITKRALLSYIVHPFFISREDPCFLNHINIWHAQEIVRVLNHLGYSVDVVDYTDRDFIPQRRYDLFIGHGGINTEHILSHLTSRAARIYFSTGCYWRFHNEQECARLDALRRRRGVYLHPDRFIHDSEEEALVSSHGIVGIGNGFTRETYSRFSPAVMINGTSIADDHYETIDKDFREGRGHFLYFAGNGPVHKGLDLLLEAFSGLPQHLWICTRLDQPFEDAYFDELHHRPNIHLEGVVRPRSDRFYDLTGQCAFVILPSCSEGQAQSVVECMNQGLIPVVSRACGLDIDGHGVLIDPCTIDEIVRIIQDLSAWPATRCREMAVKARTIAIKDYSEEAFQRNIRRAIQEILDQKGN